MVLQAVFQFASMRSPTSHTRQIRICDRDAAVVSHLVDSLKKVNEGLAKVAESNDNVGLVYQWSWMEDIGARSWKPFDPNENFQMEMGMNPYLLISPLPSRHLRVHLL